jgi:PAS domain S-box-containing protein
MKRALRLRVWLRGLPWDIILVYLAFNALVWLFGQQALGRVGGNMRNRSFDDLNSIVTLKSRQLGDWLQDLLRDASGYRQEIARDGVAANLIANPLDTDALSAFLAFADKSNPSHRFASVALADPSGGVRVCIPETLPVHPAALRSEVQPLLDAPWPRVSDLFRGPEDRVFLVVTAPLAGQGALVLLVDAKRELFPLLREWPIRSRTAETLLVRREGDRVVYLNDLRFHEGAALNLSSSVAEPLSPAAEAMRKPNGVMEGVDYRGARVLAAWRSVPGSAWSIVAKVDAAEVEQPVRMLALTSLLLAIALGAASTLFLVLRLRQLAGHQRAERQALVSHYGYLARYANDIILLLDAKGRILEANEKAAETYGFSHNELLALRYDELDSSTPPASVFPEAVDGMLVESEHRRKDGSRFPVEASIRSIQVGRRRYIQCILRDISERRKSEAEKRRFEEQIARLRKQEAIAQLAGGIAHELNNALTAIMGYAEYLKAKLPPGGIERHSTQGILDAVSRASSITHGLLVFSEQQSLVCQPLDLGDLLRASEKVLRQRLGERVQLHLELEPRPLPIRGDAELLRLALSHLADNARQAMPQGGRFTVAAGPVAGPAPEQARTTCLSVRDTGQGMSEEVRSRLFEPFFTTRGFGQGTGLGLPVVFGIVRRHGGRIEVASEPGRGTEFRIFLPLAQACAEG